MQARVKKGESTIIGYVLLIVLAIGMASAVYAFLKFYIPKDQPTCPADVQLGVDKITCTADEIHIELRNRGLFNIDGAYVKLGLVGRAFKETINCPGNVQALPPACEIYFTTGAAPYSPQKLAPGNVFNRTYTRSSELGSYELEIEPVMVIDKKPTLCEKAVVVQEVQCQ